MTPPEHRKRRTPASTRRGIIALSRRIQAILERLDDLELKRGVLSPEQVEWMRINESIKGYKKRLNEYRKQLRILDGQENG